MLLQASSYKHNFLPFLLTHHCVILQCINTSSDFVSVNFCIINTLMLR